MNIIKQLAEHHISVYIMAHRSEPNYFLAQWLKAHQLVWQRGSQVGFRVDLARNKTIKRFLAKDVPEGATHLLMIDADMVPIIGIGDGPGTNNILTYVSGELSYCPYVGHDGTRGHIDKLGAGCFKVSAKFLQRMQKPYFLVETNEDCTDMAKHPGCECEYFDKQARELGEVPKSVGLIGHMMEVVLFPSKNTKMGYEICFPHRLPYPYID